MRRMRRTFILSIVTLGLAIAQPALLQKPYLQLGNAPRASNSESMAVVWHTGDRDAVWTVEYGRQGGERQTAKGMLLRRVNVRGVDPHRVYEAVLTKLPPGEEFEYRLLLDGKSIFTSYGRARRAAGDPHRIAVFGDMSQDSKGQRALAGQIYNAKPDYLLSTGDIVYSRGLASEYYKKYFPIYNCDEPQPGKCAPILRSTLTFGILGNHDSPTKIDLASLPDALAYYYYWSQPLNGPITDRNSKSLPKLSGSKEQLREFYRSAPNYPRMANFSFDYGGVHWTMLDSNPYVNWTDPKLVEWVREDLRSARGAAWRFVALHHPPFQSSHKHFDDQWMRAMAQIFEQEKVDIVFSGHVHNYQRSYPIHFDEKPNSSAKRQTKYTPEGSIRVDRTFDGAKNTKPDGIIWLVTGAGGASLYDGEQESDSASWQSFTTRFVSTVHSFTLVEITPMRLEFRQISRDGKEVDRFSVTR